VTDRGACLGAALFGVVEQRHTNGNIVADDSGGHISLGVVPGHMNRHPILDIGVLSDLYVVHIPYTGCR
jgi:hypothetical protein